MYKFCTFALLWHPILVFSQTVDRSVVRQVDSLVTEGRNLLRTKDMVNAEIQLLQATKLAKERLGSENATYPYALHWLGNLYSNAGKPDEAIVAWEEALAIRGRVLGPLHPDYGRTLNNLGVGYEALGNLQKARETLLEALYIKEKTAGRESLDYSNTLYALSNLANSMGQLDEALQFAKACYDIRNLLTQKGSPQHNGALNLLGNAYLSLSEYDTALFFYRLFYENTKAVDISAHIGAANNLVALYNQMGQYEKAEHLAIEALALPGVDDFGAVKILLLENLASSLTYMGRLSESDKIVQQLLEMTGEQGNVQYGRLLNHLGTLFYLQEKWADAERNFRDFKNLSEALFGKQHPEYALACNSLGELYSRTGKFYAAEQHLLEALAVYEANGSDLTESSTTYLNLGLLYLRQNRLQEAEKAFLECQRIRSRRYHEQSERMEDIFSRLFLLYYFMRQPDPAVHFALRSDNLLKANLRRSAGYLSDRELMTAEEKNAAKNHLLLAAANQYRQPELLGAAYDNALFFKGFLLETNLLLKKAVRTSEPDVQTMFQEWQGLQRRLANSYASQESDLVTTDALEAQANRMEKQLSQVLMDVDWETPRWQQVQAALKPGEAAVEFYRVPFRQPGEWEPSFTQYFALLIRQEDRHPHLVPLFKESDWENICAGMADEKQPNLNRLYTTADLYRLVWHPMEPYLENISKIWFSPDGQLHRIAFGMLMMPDGQRLNRRFELVQVGSTRQLTHTHETSRETVSQSAVVFGGINYDAAIVSESGGLIAGTAPQFPGRAGGNEMFAQWEYLPASGIEAKMVEHHLKTAGFRTERFDADNATEANLKKRGLHRPSPAVLHIATHGFFYEKQPSTPQLESNGGQGKIFVSSPHSLMRSGLLLAGANHVWKGGALPHGAEDGVLTAFEISQLDFSGTQLVVMSACDSGLGVIQGSEGVFGLQRAFKLAGAKNLVMSLWQIPDESSKMLMDAFYNYLLKEKMPAAQALYKAQTVMEEAIPDPYYWAGFVVME